MTDTPAEGRPLSADAPWLVKAVSVTVSAIVLVSFVLSFTAQRELAIASHIPAMIAWGWPLIVDGTIVVATFAVFILRPRSRGATRYPWVILISFGGLSIYANGVHATGIAPGTVAAFVIGAVPAVALLVSTHLLVITLTSSRQVVSDKARVRRAKRAARPGRQGGDVRTAARPASPQRRTVTAKPKPVSASREAVKSRVRSFSDEHGTMPTSAVVAEWAGTSERTGRRIVLEVESELAAPA